MTTYRCAACNTILEVEKLPIGNIVEVKPCEACLEAAEEGSREKGYEEGYNYREAVQEAKEETALDATDASEFEIDPNDAESFLAEGRKEKTNER